MVSLNLSNNYKEGLVLAIIYRQGNQGLGKNLTQGHSVELDPGSVGCQSK